MLRKKKSNQIIFCLVVLGLMIFNLSIFFPNIFATEYSVARIVSVDYPKSVEPSQSFHIFVEAEYQDSFYIDIGIRNLKKDEFLQSLTSINEFYGPGKEDFIFNLTSPPKEGDLQLEATTRAWWRNAWFADPNQGTMKFVIRVIEPSEKEIELAANQTIQVFENDRLRFIGWSDGVNSNPRKIWANYEDTIAPIYRRQFFLKISSQLNFIEGQGWYDENDNATLEAPSRIPFEEKIYLFKGWQGDIKSSKPLVETKMNGKKRSKLHGLR